MFTDMFTAYLKTCFYHIWKYSHRIFVDIYRVYTLPKDRFTTKCLNRYLHDVQNMFTQFLDTYLYNVLGHVYIILEYIFIPLWSFARY